MPPILLVEDDPLIRHAFATLLRAEGHSVLVAGTAEAGLQAAARQAPALVLLDVGLPGMDGIECARELRAMKLQAPIIFLTAFGGSEFVDRALASRPHAYLVKPVSGEQLIPMVRSALAAAEAESAQQERMQGALDDSRSISAAVGMLAERHDWTLDQAFAALRLMARSESRPIVELARELTSRLR
jgi:DNA-binding response OmpR family regulator